MDQPSLLPNSKMTAVAVSGAIVTAIVGVLSVFNIAVPANVSSASLVVVSALVTVISFAAGYIKRERALPKPDTGNNQPLNTPDSPPIK